MKLPTFDPGDPNESIGASEWRGAANQKAREILDRVIRLTLVTPSPAGSVDRTDVEALREVVNRHRGKPFAVEPIAVELVQAMLWTYFESWAKAPDSWAETARHVAQSLCDDPAALKRTEQLWTRLAESAL